MKAVAQIVLIGAGFAVTALLSTGACASSSAEETPLAGPQWASTAQTGQKLRLSSRREGINPYLPGASHLISIQIPEEALREGWRCCWIEAFSRETANALSAQYGKTVFGNESDLIFDAARTESSLRQVAPGIFTGYLALDSVRRTGSHSVRLYVHLYRLEDAGDASFYRPVSPQSDRSRDRIARNFLDEPVLTVRFMYAANGGLPNRTQAPPSQLPNYAPPRQ
jgi:hypothetical protein